MGKVENRSFHRFRLRFGVYGFVVMSFLFQSFHLCWSLNEEGLTLLKFRERVVNDPFGALSNWNDHKEDINPCFWFGVECSDGKVVSLNLKDLCLQGTLAPELKNLLHIKSINLRNNSFIGTIPQGLGGLEELEVLDLGYNNFCGPLPSDLGSNLSLGILLLDNNKHLGGLSPEIYQLQLLSEFQVDENHLSNTAEGSLCNKESISCDVVQVKDSRGRRELRASASQAQSTFQSRVAQIVILTSPLSALSPPPLSGGTSEAPPVPPSSPPPAAQDPRTPPPPHPGISSNETSPPTGISISNNETTPPPLFRSPPPTKTPPEASKELPPPQPASNQQETGKKKSSVGVVVGASVGAAIFVIALAVGIYLWTNNKATVKPWATGLSGQLQKAFVTGVPKLKRSELEVSCEDFSNVIGYSPIGPVYKGTLSSGVEIAVNIISVKSSKDWSMALESQFRKKIDTLSKINHKNFVNLIGYCEEEEPFSRMMVFEYAPNGTVFEHLHDEEFEHLNWRMRMRIAMGMAYCLEYLHEQNTPLIQLNLTSSAINLTEDYAAKISECSLQNEIVADERICTSGHLLNTSSGGPESQIYSFGLVLLELMTGRIPHSAQNGLLEDWAIQYLRLDKPLKKFVDPTLTSFQEEQLEQIGQLLRSCLHSNPEQRPTMKLITSRLRLITGITPDEAIPRLSPLWWAELEIASEGR
ncbi:probable inactive receptor-like protein kinase At3g56050 isoform X2 [Benincasa hispida]|uniref:probable inactive receptor-like protein kinase At3g56050 isoform X2 n=1 Tax=Benincasa hispida TaxID=102211 RepID=UPI0019007B97|nr:probable inactive receptor-like protein kinase At3g56050 isoform X2 [Benincasa hispida]